MIIPLKFVKEFKKFNRQNLGKSITQRKNSVKKSNKTLSLVSKVLTIQLEIKIINFYTNFYYIKANKRVKFKFGKCH